MCSIFFTAKNKMVIILLHSVRDTEFNMKNNNKKW